MSVPDVRSLRAHGASGCLWWLDCTNLLLVLRCSRIWDTASGQCLKTLIGESCRRSLPGWVSSGWRSPGQARRAPVPFPVLRVVWFSERRLSPRSWICSLREGSSSADRFQLLPAPSGWPPALRSPFSRLGPVPCPLKAPGARRTLCLHWQALRGGCPRPPLEQT